MPPAAGRRRCVPDQAGQALRPARRAARRVDAPARTDRAAPARQGGARRCLVVAEDNPVNRKLVTTLLKKRGHR